MKHYREQLYILVTCIQGTKPYTCTRIWFFGGLKQSLLLCRFGVCQGNFEVLDNDGEIIAKIFGPCCIFRCCTEITFEVVTFSEESKTTKHMAMIHRSITCMLSNNRRPFHERIVNCNLRRKRERSTYVCLTKSYDLRVTFKVDRKSTSR